MDGALINAALPGGWMRAALACALLVSSGGATGQRCTFVTGSLSPSALQFGSLDPSIATDRTAVMSVQTLCTTPPPPGWSFQGINGNAPLRMRNSALDAYIPYSVAVTQTAAGQPPRDRTWRITATVLGVDYQNAPVGAYSDVLTATLLP
jgi:hypothetical protein